MILKVSEITDVRKGLQDLDSLFYHANYMQFSEFTKECKN